MAYVPPACNNIQFNVEAFTAPAPCSPIIFHFGQGIANVQITDSYIKIVSDMHLLYMGEGVIISDSSIFIQSDSVDILEIKGVVPTDSIIKVQSSEALIRMLPSVQALPSEIKIQADIAQVKMPSGEDFPFALHDGWGFRWSNYSEEDKKDFHTIIPWNKEDEVDIHIQIPNDPFDNLDQHYIIPWESMLPYEHKYKFPWDVLFIHNIENTIPWASFIQHRNDYIIPWDKNNPYDKDLIIPWLYPERLHYHYSIPWGESVSVSYEQISPWLYPDAVDETFDIVWGPIDWRTICQKKYWPPPVCGKVTFQIKEKIISNICEGIIFSIGPDPSKIGEYCPYKHVYSGRRDPFDTTLNPVIPPEDFITKEVYTMHNTVTVQRLPDMKIIEVTAINIKYDRSSYLWTFSMQIGKDKTNYLDMIKPSPDNANTYVDVLITINQRHWVCRVEGYRENRVFGKDSWQVQGRSPSMELGAPVCKKSSFTFDPTGNSPTSGAGIIQSVLQGTLYGIDDKGWKADFSAYGPNIHTGFVPSSADDWGIQAKTFSWNSNTQIEIVRKLTDSIGAFIMTEPDCRSLARRTLYVKPMFNIPPWHWNNPAGTHFPTVDYELSTDLCLEVSRNYAEMPDYNAVHVMGTVEAPAQHTNPNPGLTVLEVYREGIGPEFRVYAPDIVDDNIQSWKAALERGRMQICDTGFWLKHDMRLFSVSYPDSTDNTLPPLVLPGGFCKVHEKNHERDRVWYGVADALSIDVSVNANGTVYVVQTVAINEYID